MHPQSFACGEHHVSLPLLVQASVAFAAHIGSRSQADWHRPQTANTPSATSRGNCKTTRYTLHRPKLVILQLFKEFNSMFRAETSQWTIPCLYPPVSLDRSALALTVQDVADQLRHPGHTCMLVPCVSLLIAGSGQGTYVHGHAVPRLASLTPL